jgi:hypothetical protein
MSDDTQVLDAKRYAKQFKQHELYIVVSENDNNIHAVQVNASDRDWNGDYHIQSMAEAICRLTSLVLRPEPCTPQQVIHELRNSSRGDRTLPAIVAAILEQHIGRKG